MCLLAKIIVFFLLLNKELLMFFLSSCDYNNRVNEDFNFCVNDYLVTNYA